MPLHIFEPRYREMLSDCLDGDGRFGLLYHDWDRQGPFLCEEGRIGCVAEIRKHEGLEDGRSLIVVEGSERFKISDGVESESPYFEALVTPFLDTDVMQAEDLAVRRRESIQLFEAVVASLPTAPERLPTLEPEKEVSFVLARTIQVDPSWHQYLLELRDEVARLTVVDQVFRAALS